MSDIVAELRSAPIQNEAHVPEPYRKDLITFMDWVGQLQTQGVRHFFGVSRNCRLCQYRAPAGTPERSGVHECWQMAMRQGLLHGTRDLTDRDIPLSIDLWGVMASECATTPTRHEHDREH